MAASVRCRQGDERQLRLMNQVSPQIRFERDVLVAPPAEVAGAEIHGVAAMRDRAAAALALHPISRLLGTGLVRLGELVAVAAIGLALYLAYVAPEDGIEFSYSLPLFRGSLLAILLIQLAGGYQVPALRRGVPDIGRVFLAWTLVFALFAVVAFFAKAGDTYS